MSTEALKRELSELVILALDGQLDHNQTARLNELIISSDILRSYYLDCLTTQVGLGIIDIQISNNEPNSDNLLRDVVEAQLAEQEQAKLALEIPKEPQTITYQRKAISPLAIWQVFGAIAALIAVALFLNILQPDQTPSIPSSQIRQPIAQIIATSKLKWTHNDQKVEIHQYINQDKYIIDSGYAKLRTNDNIEILLEGPVEFELISNSVLALNKGRCTINVPKGAEGFKVETPNATFLDLGTDFGVNVTDELSELYVFDGQVVFYAGPRDSLEKRPFETLQAGDAARLASKSLKIIDIEYNETAFARRIPSEYELHLRQLGPQAYWSFDNIQNHMLDNAINQRFQGDIFGQTVIVDGPETTNTGHLSAIYLDGLTNYARITDIPPGSSANLGYSYCMWVKPDFLPTSENANDKYYLFVGYGRYGHLLVDGAGHFTHHFISSVDNAAYDIQKSQEPFIPGQWYHVLVNVDPIAGKQIYINGESASEPIKFQAGAGNCKEIFIGNIYSQAASHEPDGNARLFKGSIANAALFDRALTEEEIKELYGSY